ncbi:MAG: hypothetical protein GXO49_03350 [Chlorobi bacterium]|nr:hypothetical protein [Chlorobiota bacterium]
MEFYKERDLGEIFQDTFKFFKSEIKIIINVLLVFVFPFSLYGIYFMFKSQDVLESELINMFQTQDFSNIPNEFYVLIGFSILQQILTILSVGAIIKLKFHNEPVNISNVFKIVVKYFTSVFAGQMFVSLVIFSGIFIFALIGLVSFGVFFLLIIWAIYVLVSMYLLSFIIIFEDVPVIGAVKRSLQLIKGNWWFTFGTILVFGLVVGISEMIVSSIITQFVGFISKSDIAAIVVLFLDSLLSLVLSAISIIVPAFLYASYVTKINTEEEIN